MKYFGFLSFGHYSNGGRQGITAAESLHQAIDLSVAADELGVNGAFFRVHHFAPQAAAPMPLLSAIASRTKAIEVGTGVIDMRYENPPLPRRGGRRPGPDRGWAHRPRCLARRPRNRQQGVGILRLPL